MKALLQLSLTPEVKARVVSAAGGPRKVSQWVEGVLVSHLLHLEAHLEAQPDGRPDDGRHDGQSGHVHTYAEPVRRFGRMRRFCTSCQHMETL